MTVDPGHTGTPAHRAEPALTAATPGSRGAYLLRITRAEQWWDAPEDPVTWQELKAASTRVGLVLRRVGHADCEWQQRVRGWGLEPVLGGSLVGGVVTVLGATTDVTVAKRMTRLVTLLEADLQGESGEAYALFPVLTPRQAAASGRRATPPRSTGGLLAGAAGLERLLTR
ncbi:MAG: hypothetical protein JWM64_2775, partial [Frankiales bacterium]|nr:hypothetical protein [Frankiales bacterium]